MTSPLPVFDDVYVISDLHMGGGRGHQIFNQGELLAEFIDQLTSSQARRNRALVINGDSVDFIAEPNAVYFDPDGAIDKLDRIMGDPAFSPVWNALRGFVKKKNRMLFINLGNHDLELALPEVREHLLQVLTEEDESRRGRIGLIFDGTGVRCRVGNASVLCLHGNEVDDWNICDYETLRRQGRGQMLNVTEEPWVPNAGTKLVVEVMNPIKKKYPFVDLLKPEDKAVVPTLYALDPGLKPKMSDAMGVLGRLMKDKAFRMAGFLEGGDDDAELMDSDDDLNRMLLEKLDKPGAAGQSASALNAGGNTDDEMALLRETEQLLRGNADPLLMSGGDAESRQLGVFDAVKGLFTREEPAEILRRALEGLTEDQSFEFTQRDSTFEGMDEFVGDRIDFLITGHTHQQRALQRSGGGFYYNSGTWVRLIQLRPEILRDPEQFSDYFNTFEEGTMQALDDKDGMILKRQTVVSVSQHDDGSVHGCLNLANSTPDGLELTPVDGTEFRKG